MYGLINVFTLVQQQSFVQILSYNKPFRNIKTVMLLRTRLYLKFCFTRLVFLISTTIKMALE